eukprot:3485478-Pyramimonas_sp.AAC.1
MTSAGFRKLIGESNTDKSFCTIGNTTVNGFGTDMLLQNALNRSLRQLPGYSPWQPMALRVVMSG